MYGAIHPRRIKKDPKRVGESSPSVDLPMQRGVECDDGGGRSLSFYFFSMGDFLETSFDYAAQTKNVRLRSHCPDAVSGG